MVFGASTAEKVLDEPLMGKSEWRLRRYVVALIISIGLYLAVHGTSANLPIFISVLAMIAVGTWQRHGPLLPVGVLLGLTLATLHPVILSAMAEQRSLASVLDSTQIWPQMLVAIFSSRVLSCQQELNFQRFWQNPLADASGVSIQSFPSAIALGAFLTMLHYAVISNLSLGGASGASSIVVSALLGHTVIHTLIIFLFFVVLALIGGGLWDYRSDRLALKKIRRFLKTQPIDAVELDLVRAFPMLSHRRVIRVLIGAIELKAAQDMGKVQLATLSFDSFHRASRQFIRTLIPFLTLLGFLGTVIGLATAVSGLPGNLTPEQGGIDISASLAGLAVKFETTLLGLVSMMIASLLLNFLEKKEHQLTAECLLVINQRNSGHA